MQFTNESDETVVALDIYNNSGNLITTLRGIQSNQTVSTQLAPGTYRLVAHILDIAELNNVDADSTVVLNAEGQLEIGAGRGAGG